METLAMDDAREECSPVDVPIAIRKGKRKSSAISLRKSASLQDWPATRDTSATTPPRRRLSKRVRFSDTTIPGPVVTSSSLTPYLRRHSLGSPRQRRPDTPAHCVSNNEVQFTPLTQILDERCKRRIRRNGLSHVVNEYEADKKSRAAMEKEIQAKNEELVRLRAQLVQSGLDQTDLESLPSHKSIDEVEAELEALRQSFSLDDGHAVTNWDDVPMGSPGQPSDGGDTIPIWEDEIPVLAAGPNPLVDSDGLQMGLDLESARQTKGILFRSRSRAPCAEAFDFADSPTSRTCTPMKPPPLTPRTFFHDLSKQLKATTNRAEDAELALHQLQCEVKSLGFMSQHEDGSALVSGIAQHFRQMRLEIEHLLPGETVSSFDNSKILPDVVQKLRVFAQQLQDREAELKSMREQQRTLKGNFDHAIRAAESAHARVKELEDTMDQGVEEMLQARIRAQSLEKEIAEKDSTVASLIEALERYRSDIGRMEHLVFQMESEQPLKIQEAKDKMAQDYQEQVSDMEANVVAEERGRRAAEQSAVERLADIKALESTLATVRLHAGEVEARLARLQDHITASTQKHEVEVGALMTRISGLSTALASANAEVDKLKITKAKLEERVRDEVEQGARAVEAMQAEVIRSVTKTNENKKSYIRSAKVRTANWELADSDDADSAEPMTPASLVRFVDPEADDHVEGSVEVSRGKNRYGRGLGLSIQKSRRRMRYDSGIGMDSLDEIDEEDVRDGLLTPELSSEAEIDLSPTT